MYLKKNYPEIIGGLDIEKNGTWIAINTHGLIAVIHNRKLEKNNSLNKDSRGQIILNLLKFDNLDLAISSIEHVNQSIYNGFNIILKQDEEKVMSDIEIFAHPQL